MMKGVPSETEGVGTAVSVVGTETAGVGAVAAFDVEEIATVGDVHGLLDKDLTLCFVLCSGHVTFPIAGVSGPVCARVS